jgi:hypothetical protein
MRFHQVAVSLELRAVVVQRRKFARNATASGGFIAL